MGFIASLFLLSTAVNSCMFLAVAPANKNIVSTTMNDSRPSMQETLDANLTARPDTSEGVIEDPRQRAVFPRMEFIQNDEIKILSSSLVEHEQPNVGTDTDYIKGFAVFVDSPDESDESKQDVSVRSRKTSIMNDDENADEDLAKETRIKQVISNKFRNGSVIHDIRIAVKHPQNMKGHKLSVSKKNKKVSRKRIETKDTSLHKRKKLVENGTNTKLPVTVSGENSIFSKSDQEDGQQTISDSTFTVLTNEFYLTNFTDILFTHQENETTTFSDGLTHNSSENDSVLVSSSTGTGSSTKSTMCSSVIFLNLTKSENCVSKCLLSCMMSKKNSGANESSASSEELLNVYNNSSSEVSVVTKDDAEHSDTIAGNGTTNGNESVMNTTFYTEQVETTHETEINLNVPIGSEIEHYLLGTSEVKNSDVTSLVNDICLTEKCVLKAAEFLKRMDPSIDPCMNFYEFSCGGFYKHEIPNDNLLWSVFTEIASDIIFSVISVLREPVKTSEPYQVIALKHFFTKCTKTPLRMLFMEFLQELGGWPAPNNPSWKSPFSNWQDIAFNWTYGELVEYNFVLLNIYNFNKTGEWVLSLDLPVFVEVVLNSNNFEFLKKLERETAVFASVLGVDNETITSSIEVQYLFMEYAISYANESRMNKQEAFYSLGQLKKMLPHLTILKNLPSLLETSISIGDDEVIRVSDVVYLQKINTLIRDTPVKTQAALLVMSAMQMLFGLVSSTKDSSMARYCVKLAWQLYPNIVSNIYSDNFVDDSTVNGVLTVLRHVKNRLEKTLRESSLENATKLKMVEKLNSLKFTVGNRMDREFDRISVGVPNSSFASMVKLGIFDFKRSAYTFLHQDYNTTIPKLMQMYSDDFKYRVNAFVVSSHVFLPLPVMHQNIYDDVLPFYVNFAGVGVLMGHEIVHGVVHEESLRHSSRYRAEEQCLIDQFNSFTERYLELPINGRVTKSENIADLGGFREAYLAYTEWAKYHSEKELKLPGLHRFNNRQMFWLTAASNWCQVASREAMILLKGDTHAPVESRINGPLANLPEFSRDFHCPLDSPMNPRDKCSLW